MISQENKKENKNNLNILKLSNRLITSQKGFILELNQLNKQLRFKNQRLFLNKIKIQKQLNLKLNRLQRNNLNQKMTVGSLSKKEDDLYEYLQMFIIINSFILFWIMLGSIYHFGVLLRFLIFSSNVFMNSDPSSSFKNWSFNETILDFPYLLSTTVMFKFWDLLFIVLTLDIFDKICPWKNIFFVCLDLIKIYGFLFSLYYSRDTMTFSTT